MKSELSSIKNDFEKLIRKEINLKPQQDLLKSTNSHKEKYKSTRKDNRSVSEFEKIDFGTCQRGQDENKDRLFHLEKQLPCSSDSKAKISKTLQLRNENKAVEPSAFDHIDLKESKLSAQDKVSSKEVAGLKEKVRKLENDLFNQKKETE